MSLERLKFERERLREAVQNARDDLRRELEANEEFRESNSCAAHALDKCNDIEYKAKMQLANADAELRRCDEVLRLKL